MGEDHTSQDQQVCENHLVQLPISYMTIFFRRYTDINTKILLTIIFICKRRLIERCTQTNTKFSERVGLKEKNTFKHLAKSTLATQLILTMKSIKRITIIPTMYTIACQGTGEVIKCLIQLVQANDSHSLKSHLKQSIVTRLMSS